MFRRFDEKIAQLVEVIFHEKQKGHRYIKDQLKRRYGLLLNDKTVLRYMHILGLVCPIRKKRFHNCTVIDNDKKARIVCTNVLARDFRADRPLLKLVTDVSYIHHRQGRLYISIIKDLYDNSILAYNISRYNDNSLVFENLKMLFECGWNPCKECIIHSDQGFQYTNQTYLRLLDEKGITVSHSRKANCYDNACCENFFSHLKSEELELQIPENEVALIEAVQRYINFYNEDRPQRKLKGMTPHEFRKAYLNN